MALSNILFLSLFPPLLLRNLPCITFELDGYEKVIYLLSVTPRGPFILLLSVTGEQLKQFCSAKLWQSSSYQLLLKERLSEMISSDFRGHSFIILSLVVILALVSCFCANPADGFAPGKRYRRSLPKSRRLDCDLFCRRTGFRGAIGGCQCGLTLFTFKRSESGR